MSEQRQEKQTQREMKAFNRASENLHGTLVRSWSHVRLSLTIRIALHYCWQLFRSAIWMLLALALCWSFVQHRWVSRTLGELPAALTQEELSAGYALPEGDVTLTAYPEEEAEDNLTGLRLAFRRAGAWSYCRAAALADGTRVLVVFAMAERLKLLLLMWAAALGADCIRMLYFLRHHQRLDKTLLSPIRDMTQMAETISANNLSNRINVAGTKNELRDLAVVINSMLDRLERSYNSQKQFVSDASHELRTPIAVIQGYADMLKRWGKDDPEVLAEGLDAISAETESMKDLVENLLFLARHDKRTMMLELSTFDPADLVEEVRREEEMVSGKDHFGLAQLDHCQLEADRNMVKQVLRILTDNAVKYSPEGAVITLGCAQKEQNCVLTVSDNGSGISEEDLPHIFDRFYRADKARKSEAGGHGLGLSIARIIVVAHGGKIRVRSKLGEGTSFSILLPLKQAAGQGSQLEAPVDGDTGEESGKRRRRKKDGGE